MAWGNFQTAVAASTNGNDATTPALDTTGRDWAAVCVAWYGGGAITVSDSKSNTPWNALTQRTVGTPANVRWYWAALTSVGSGHTFNVTGSGIFPSIGVITASGAHATPFDLESAGGGGDSITSAQPGNMTPNNDDSLIIAGLCCYAGSATAIDSGFTGAFQAYSAGNAMSLGIGYLLQAGSPAAVNPAFTISSSSSATAAGGVFRPATGGGGGGGGKPDSFYRMLRG